MIHFTQIGKNRGLSLIELLTTIVIMGILATAALPLGEVVFIRDKEVDLKRALYATRQAIDRFYADTGDYPTNFDELRWYWKTNKPYLRESPPMNPLANSHEAWILVLRKHKTFEPLPKEWFPDSEVPYRVKFMHMAFLSYGIQDIKVPDYRKVLPYFDSAGNPTPVKQDENDTTPPTQIKLRGYRFLDPNNPNDKLIPEPFTPSSPPNLIPTYKGYYNTSLSMYKNSLDGSLYADW